MNFKSTEAESKRKGKHEVSNFVSCVHLLSLARLGCPGLSLRIMAPKSWGAEAQHPVSIHLERLGVFLRQTLPTSMHLRLSTEGPLLVLEALGQSLRSIYILELSLSSLMEAHCLPRFHKQSAFALFWLQDGEL